MIFGGIDYSMTCPGICVHNGDEWSFSNCKFLYLTKEKKWIGSFLKGAIVGKLLTETSCDPERYALLAKETVDFLDDHNCQNVILEGYAMGAKGKVFHIGENTGILKHSLFFDDIQYDIAAPTTIKKLACGTSYKIGKDEMYNAFVEDTGVDLKKEFDWTRKSIASPIGDIVDAYFIAKYNFERAKNDKL